MTNSPNLGYADYEPMVPKRFWQYVIMAVLRTSYIQANRIAVCTACVVRYVQSQNNHLAQELLEDSDKGR